MALQTRKDWYDIMKNKAITMFLLASMICSSSVIPAFAAEGTDGKADPVMYQTVTDESEDKSPVTEVKASIKSTYEVMLPKTMTVNNGDNAYTVNVKGDLAGDEAIAVAPDATVSLASEGKDAVIGNITQEKQTFTYADASKKTDGVLTGTDAAGNININGLTAGHWTGTFNFNVGTNKYVSMSANLNADKSTAKLEDTVNLTANVTDGKAPYQYQFKMREKGTEDWTNLTDYGASNTYAWTVNKTGTFEFAVDIKDASNTVVTKTTDITAITNIIPMSANLNADKSTAKLEETVNLTANVTDGKAPYQYQFKMREKGTDGWTNLKDYGASNTYAWTVDKTGTYEFAVDIKDATDTVVTKTTDITTIGKDITLYSDSLSTYGIASTGDVVIPEYVTDSEGITHKVAYIGSSIFLNATGLTSIKIPDGVKEIGRAAFFNSGLTSITIPDSVTSIEDDAFASSALRSVTYKGATYTNKTELMNALTANNVSMGFTPFKDTALSE